MTFSINVPNAAQSPGVFPAQANTNFSRLKILLGSNHKFNDTAAADDGFHQNIRIIPLTIPGTDSANGQLFANSAVRNNPLTYKDTAAVVHQVTPCYPLLASVIFSPGNPSATIISGFNVTRVSYQGAGTYKLQFTNNAPSINYIWSMNVLCDLSTGAYIMPRKSAVYETYINVDGFQVNIKDLSGSNTDSFTAACVNLYGG